MDDYGRWESMEVEDGRRFAALVKQGWEWKEEAVTIRELFEHVGKLLEPRAKITFTWVPEGAERLKVCVLYHAAFHLLLECMRNTLRHDHDPYHAGHEVKWEVLIGHQADERRVRVAIHNNRARFQHDDIRRFREYKASHGVDTLLRELPDSGLKIAWSLALLTGCDLDLDNAQLGSRPIPVGSTKITFQTGGESGTSTPAG